MTRLISVHMLSIQLDMIGVLGDVVVMISRFLVAIGHPRLGRVITGRALRWYVNKKIALLEASHDLGKSPAFEDKRQEMVHSWRAYLAFLRRRG